MKYSFIITEGIQDVAFISKILEELEFVRERYKRSTEDSQNEGVDAKSNKQIFVNKFWDKLIPKTFPAGDGGDITRGVPLPWFLHNKQICVAVQKYDGLTNLINNLSLDLQQIPPDGLFSIGIILDADTKKQPSERLKSILQGIKKQIPELTSLPGNLGTVVGNTPKVGIFILPDNTSQGTLEDLLLDCADRIYPNVRKQVEIFINNEKEWSIDLDEDEKREYCQPAGKKKLTVAGISSVMKPGRNVQNSIEDCRWLCNKTMAAERIQKFVDFLKELLGI